MRSIKDRYFKKTPLIYEDFPDSARAPRGEPKAQTPAEIHRTGTDTPILAYRYAEDSESLADPRADLVRQVRYGLLPSPV